MKILLRVSLLLMLTSMLAWAGDFWEDKQFIEWSEKDVEKMMTKSPWAKKVTLALSIGRSGGGIGGRSRDGIGGGSRGGIGGRSRGGIGGRSRAPVLQLTISWRSALPIKQAIVKARMGESTELPAGATQFLDQQEEFYVVAVTGFPTRMGRMLENSSDTVIAGTVLKRKDQSITVNNFRAEERGESTDLFFFFPRTANITLEDKTIEFIMKLGGREIKKKFKLKDMVVNGNLEL